MVRPPSVPMSKCSGRTPTVTVRSPASAAAATASRETGTTLSPNFTPPSVIGTSTRFIAGEPMKPATKRFAGRSYMLRGVSTCCSRPSLRTATRSPMVMASTWSCVTYTVVMPRSRWSAAICVRVETRSLASRFDSGSSMRKTCGLRTMARPMATRWRWPPESALGLRSRYWVRSSIFAASSTFRRMVALSSPAILSAKPMLSATVMCG